MRFLSSQATVSLTTSSTGLRISFSTSRDSSSPPEKLLSPPLPSPERVEKGAGAAEADVVVDDEEALCDVIMAEHAALAAVESPLLTLLGDGYMLGYMNSDCILFIVDQPMEVSR